MAETPPTDPDPDDFKLKGTELRCPYDMNAVMPKVLRQWCRKLLEVPGDTLTIDLSGTRHVASHHLGILSEAWGDALEKKRDLVIAISPDLRRIFQLSGFDQVFKLIEKPGP
ncbi:MAG: STAS domain-containing protein [Planctomycetota bacterium]|jgi:anti-anti-sigma regulatory factor